MSDLFDETPEARAFCESVMADIDAYRLFEDERFTKLLAGVLSTTAPDKHGELIDVDELQRLVSQTSSRVIWSSAQHDPLIQTAGRLIASRLFYAPVSRIHFIAIVAGFYDPTKLRSFSDVNTVPAPPHERCSVPADEACLSRVQVVYSRHEIPASFIEELLKDAPSIVTREPELAFRKAAAPLPILELAIPAALLFNPFSQKFLGRLGEKAADGLVELIKWVSTTVAKRIALLRKDRVVLVFSIVHRGCDISLVVDSRDETVLAVAAQSLGDGIASAIELSERLEHLQMDRLVYEFAIKEAVWKPLHGASRRIGVISDRPILSALDNVKGFSIAGTGRYEEGDE